MKNRIANSLFLIIATTVLLVGCLMGCGSKGSASFTEDGKEIQVSNRYSAHSVYFPQSSIISDNATHIVISINKAEQDAMIIYRNYKRR